jgi:hypothetical protein
LVTHGLKVKLTSRNHHYIPQFYLRGFAPAMTRKSLITVFDLDQQRMFKANPRNICGVRDYNRIDLDRTNPNAIENIYSDLESKAARSIQELEKGAPFCGKNRDIIFNLIALLAVRSPQQREKLREAHEVSLKVLMDLIFSNEKNWESTKSKIIENGRSKDEGTTYAELKCFQEKNDYKIILDNNYNVKSELESMDAVLQSLPKRNWVLIKSQKVDEHFITSDNPVVLDNFKIPNEKNFYENLVGFELSNTNVMFPLTKNLLLLGSYYLKGETIQADRDAIASLNRIVLNHTYKQLYASTSEFLISDYLGEISTGEEFLAFERE